MTSDPIWELADGSGPAQLARQFEAAWHAAPGRRPDPADFLPGGGADSAALLALLRADLALRREAGEPRRVEHYRDRFPALPGGVLVALLYEEFCLREDAGESPTLADYEARFPSAAAELREILEIHALVRAGRSAASTTGLPSTLFRRSSQPADRPRAAPLPEAGQTIAGYELVEELGRGAFARVFLARERPLADRLVALKVTRHGSREPQALARLQHTHIVPVYSYRNDPATGLHLLCMPYLGRVTLADVMAHPLGRGGDLVAALEALGARPKGRHALGRRDRARAVAWWGARLAEALQHAHDRGVLHRDIKPSNILITADGLPMLLDFNLAQGAWFDRDGDGAGVPGGTLAYMAPEHLEALADGAGDRVDARADVYALGVVVFEAIAAGARPFATLPGAASVPDILRRAAADRRAHVPSLRAARPDVPAELEAVVRRCLAPDADDRYAAAAQLAADLQAVADDAPLRHALEPLPSRTRRWLRRHRRTLVLAAPPVVAAAALAATAMNAQVVRARRETEIARITHEAEHAASDGRLDEAASLFASAVRQASEYPALRQRAEALHDRTLKVKVVRERADTLAARAEPLRFGLLGFGGDPGAAVRGVEEALREFAIPHDPDWAHRPELRLLDPARHARLRAEADELLFLWVVALDRGRPPDAARDRRALRLCDAAREFFTEAGPWPALRARYAARLTGAPAPVSGDLCPDEASALACFQRGLLCRLEGRPDAAIACLERAVALRPDHYWFQFYLGYRHERAGRLQRALEHYNGAVVLRPGAPWSLYNRAQLRRQQGELGLARADLQAALAAARGQGFEFVEARLESGIVREFLGDLAGARVDYEAVAAGSGPPAHARAARLNLAKLDLNAGLSDRAGAALDALLVEAPADPNARFGAAVLALRLGRFADAEAELTALLKTPGASVGDIHARRAVARLGLGRAADALRDAGAALRLRPTPGNERLWFRALLADHRDGVLPELLALDDPDDLTRLPDVGRPLQADLLAGAERLAALIARGDRLAVPARRCRAVLLAASGSPGADVEATEAIAAAPGASDGYLVRARIKRRAGRAADALADAERGLALAPADPRLRELRGRLLIDSGRPEAALGELERAALRGARGTAHAARASALLALDRYDEAVDAWTAALAHDAEDPHAYLGRAHALVRLGRCDRAASDLEQAVGWSGGQAELLARIALTYAACLPRRPEVLPRVVALSRQAVSTWLARGRGSARERWASQ